MRHPWFAAVALVMLAGCGGPDRDPSLGEAYIGPATTTIRSDLSLRSTEVATCRHADKVDILAKRRRMIKIRTGAGVEGWIDSRLLLSAEEMDEFRKLNTRAAGVLSQGKAIADDALNVHTVPNRQAPSVFQLEAKAPVDVLATSRAPRVNFESRLKIRSLAPPPRGAPAKKQAKAAKLAPPPPGPPPSLIQNWQELSVNPNPKPKSKAPLVTPKTLAPPQDEDWLLVRDAKGRVGWVLTRMVFMTVPDEVAQYAERARIVAYFALPHTEVKEGKPAWLWATMRRMGETHHFDSVRLFTYNTRKRRYETAFIERDLRGYLPVHVSATPTGARFSYVIESSDGGYVRKDYEFEGPRPRLLHRTAITKPESMWLSGENGDDPETSPDSPEPGKTWWRQFREWIDGLRSKGKG